MSSNAELPHHDPPSDPPRARKRRRRTMACTQCRSRKLRCDREYPICGRCQKSKNPTQCTYEDGFLWQQPNTVPATTVFSGGVGGGVGAGAGGAVGGDSTIATTTTTTTTAAVPAAANTAAETNIFASSSNVNNSNNGTPTTLPRIADRTPVHTPDSAITGWGPRTQPSETERRCEGKKDRFLETVLGVPKAAVNQEPYVHTDVLQRHPPGSGGGGGALVSHYAPHHPPHHQSQFNHYSQENTDEDEGVASPSQQLDLSPRIMMRGKETRTRFNGSGILANVMAEVGFSEIGSMAFLTSFSIYSSPISNRSQKIFEYPVRTWHNSGRI